MVYCFMIHSLAPGPCRVLYSSPFVDETPPDGVTVTDERGRRKLQLLQVAQRVQSEYSFRYVASGSASHGDLSGLSSTEEYVIEICEQYSPFGTKIYVMDICLQTLSVPRSEQFAEHKLEELKLLLSHLKTGVFRLSPGNPFNFERVVLWKGLANCGFTLICEKDENRLVADNILNVIIRHLQEYCQIILQPSEAILKADKVAAITHQFLPEGQLLFMNNRFLWQVEKELEQVMNTK